MINNCYILCNNHAEITMPFESTEIHKNGHKGIDLVARVDGVNTTCYICALEDGVILAQRKWVMNHTENPPDFGNCVYIDHGNGIVTKYAHLRSGMPDWIRDGAKVQKGDILGYMGRTGYATGAHLHFQIEENGVPIDPLPYLTKDKTIFDNSKNAYYISSVKAFEKEKAERIVAAFKTLGIEVKISDG